MRCIFVSDLHGSGERYRKLFEAVAERSPEVVLLGGDLLGSPLIGGDPRSGQRDFFSEILVDGFSRLAKKLGEKAPRVLLILGNDDGRKIETAIVQREERGAWTYLHNRPIDIRGHRFVGYAYVPPTPFALKDWERYDVSRFVDPGCISPEEGRRTVPVSCHEAKYSTIAADLERLAAEDDQSQSVWLFHAPPYETDLDRADLDGRTFEYVPLDVHVGSIAIRRFIESRQPLVTLHGHVHESARLTGNWKQQLGSTWMLSAAHDGPELSLVTFDLDAPGEADRELL